MVWLCDQEPVCTFKKGPPPEKAKLRRWWTYLSQLQLSLHHIQGVKNDCADYISRSNFDDMVDARSEELAKEAFSRMDVHLDLIMTMIRPPDGLQQVEYLKGFEDIYKRLKKRLDPVLVNQEQWKRDKTYLNHEDRIVVPSDRILALLQLTHESSSHVGADCTLRLFKQQFNSTRSDDQLRKTLQAIVDKCLCRSCKRGDIRDRGLYLTLPIPHCANSVLYVDYTEMPKSRGYDLALVVTCGLTRFTRVFACTKHITGEESIKILLEEWFCVDGAPKEINSDEDDRVRSDSGWYKRFLRSLNVQVSTGSPYTHTSNPLCERQIRVLKENMRIWCKTERTKDWVRLLRVISLMMDSKESLATRVPLLCVFDTAGYGNKRQDKAGYGRIRQNTAGYGRIRQHTAGYGRIRPEVAGYGRKGRIRQDTAGYGSIRHDTAGYSRIRQDTAGSKISACSHYENNHFAFIQRSVVFHTVPACLL